MAIATLTSRVLGMVREMVYAWFMGDTKIAGAFLFAFQVPNQFRRQLGEGAVTAAFIPIFKEKEKTHGEIEMWRAANAVISGLVISASVIIALAMVGISIALAFGGPHGISALADPQGLAHYTTADGMLHHGTAGYFSEKTVLILRLLRVMFPGYMLLVCVAAAFMGMLNACLRTFFHPPAMGATMLNVVMIASVWWLAPKFGVWIFRRAKDCRCKFCARLREAGSRRGTGRPFNCRPSGGRLSLSLGFAVARRHCAARRASDDSRHHRRSGVSDQCDDGAGVIAASGLTRRSMPHSTMPCGLCGTAPGACSASAAGHLSAHVCVELAGTRQELSRISRHAPGRAPARCCSRI